MLGAIHIIIQGVVLINTPNNYAIYHFGNDSIIKDNSYSISFGDLLEFMDGKNNTMGHLFQWRHPDVGNIYLEVTDTNLNFLYSICWQGWDNTYIADFSSYLTLPINNEINYLLVKNNTMDEANCLFIVDLEQGVIKDTLLTPFKIGRLSWGNRNELLFYPEDSEDQYIIDYTKFETKTIDLTDFMEINDTLGQVYQGNIYGNNLRFESLNNICTVDSLNGSIILAISPDSIPEGESKLSFIVLDGYGKDTVVVSLVKHIGILDMVNMVAFYPNPAHDFLNVKNQSQQKANAQLFNIQGVLLKEICLPVNETCQIDIRSFCEGIYILNFSIEGTSIMVKQFVVIP